MRKKNFKGRCEKRVIGKCAEVCRTYDAIQYAYADLLQASDEVVEIRCNVLLDGLDIGEYTSDFVCTKTVNAAVGGLTRTLARELGPLNIRVNSIMPGGFTDNCAEGLKLQSEEIQKWAKQAFKENPFEKIGDPYEDVTPILLFLASDDSHWMTGQNLHADGGAWITD